MRPLVHWRNRLAVGSIDSFKRLSPHLNVGGHNLAADDLGVQSLLANLLAACNGQDSSGSRQSAGDPLEGWPHGHTGAAGVAVAATAARGSGGGVPTRRTPLPPVFVSTVIFTPHGLSVGMEGAFATAEEAGQHRSRDTSRSEIVLTVAAQALPLHDVEAAVLRVSEQQRAAGGGARCQAVKGSKPHKCYRDARRTSGWPQAPPCSRA